MTMDEQQQDQQQEQQRTVKDLTSDELRTMLEDAAARAVADSAEQTSVELASGFSSLAESMVDTRVVGTVSIDDAQYQELRSLVAAGLHGEVVVVGLCSLILGAVVAAAMTLHWRGSRG